MPHVSEEQMAALLDGSLAAASREPVRAHLKECARCAEALARDARVEMLLWEARQELVPCAVCGRLGDQSARRCGECGAALRAGSFRVTGLLARTEHSGVYRAEDETGRQVALKEVPLAGASGERLAALEREGRLLQQLRHPRIPRFVASFLEGEGAERRYYLAQDLVEGDSLLARLERHRFEEAEVVSLARQVIEILVYLQGLSPPVFHRDVKPANLVVRSDGTLSLVDFGAARDLGSTVDGTLVGTFGYMAPEQHAGIVDATTDLYALGATLLHLLSRRPPWELTGRSDPTDELSLSAPLRSFLRRLLAATASERFASARDALAALDALGERRAPSRSLRRLTVGACAFGATTVLGYAGFAAATVTEVSWLPGAPPPAFSPLDKTLLLHAVFGGVLFVARLVIQLFGGHDSDGSGHDGGDAHAHHGGGDWSVFTLHGLSAFLLLFGLFGLALSRQSHAGGILSLCGGLVAGAGGLLGVAALFRLGRRLESSGTLELANAVGQQGTVYLTIPADGEGKVHVVVQNRLVELSAVSGTGAAIPTGKRVRVVLVKKPNILVVEPLADRPEAGRADP